MRLTMKERQVVTKALADGYRRATKGAKGEILHRFVEATGYHRRYGAFLLRNHGRILRRGPGKILRGDLRQKVPRCRARFYGPEVREALRPLWMMLDFLSGKRLVPALKEVIPILEAQGERSFDPEVRAKLLSLSPATADRLLKEEKARYALKRRSLTKPGTLLKHQIPIRTFSDWDDAKPGFVEVDLVGHDGGTAQGDFCFTLDLVDVATGWTEQAAVPNKAEVWVFEAIKKLRGRLPFALTGLDSDNGGEFINNQLKRYCEREEIIFTRSRPYRKNDTCYVEQKNWSVVRRFVGYRRYDTERELKLLNALYERLRLFSNFFLPTMRLKEKVRDGARVTRRYEKPVTPYARLVASPQIGPETKERLRKWYAALNPASLHREILEIQEHLIRTTTRKEKERRRNTRAREGGPPGEKPAGSAPAAFPTGGWKTPPDPPRRSPEFPTPPTAPTTSRPPPLG